MKGKTFFKCFSILFLVTFISLFVLLLVCYITVYKEKYVMKYFDKNNYYSEIQNSIKLNVRKLDIKNKDSVLSLFTIDIIKEDVNNYISSYYKKEANTTHSSMLESKLFAREGLDKESIDNIITIYEKEIRMNNNFTLIPKSVFHFMNDTGTILVTAFNIIIISYLFLLIVCKFKNIGVLILSSSMVTFLTELIIHRVYKIDIFNGWFRELYMDILSDVCFKLILCGVLLFIGGLIIYIFEKVVSNKEK